MVGFFIVEDRVQRSAEALAAGGSGDAGWESAVAVLKAPLDAAFEALQSAPPLLALKDFMSLACTSLGAANIPPGPSLPRLLALPACSLANNKRPVSVH